MLPMLASFLLKGLVVLLSSKVIPGIRVNGYGAAFTVSVVYALLTVLLKQLLASLFFPLVILSLGLFMLVINGFLLWLTDKALESFEIKGLQPLVLATLFITLGDVVVQVLMNQIHF